MHIQRIHYGKLLLILLFVTLCMTLVIYSGEGNNRNTIDVALEEAVINDESMTIDESLTKANIEKCPVCLGRDLCQEISQNFITVSIFGDKTSYGVVYTGSLNEEEHLNVMSPPEELWESWDKHVCRNISRGKTCNVAEAAPLSFLYTWRGDANSLRTIHGYNSGDKNAAQLTACVTRNMVETLKRAFDDNHDGGFSLEEKSMLLSTVAVSPATTFLRLGRVLGLSNIPRYIGSCGRLSVYQGDFVPLRDFLHSDWTTRAELATQVLSLIDSLLSHEQYVFIVWDLVWEDFSVTKSGQVVVTALDKVTPVDKSLIEASMEDRPVCNKECFDQFQADVAMATPRGQPGKGCSHAAQFSDLMFRDVCLNVFLDQASKGPGLLHSAPPEVARLVAECAVEEGVGGRWTAVSGLLSELGASDNDDDITDADNTESSGNSTTEIYSSEETDDTDEDEDDTVTENEDSDEENN